MSEDEQAISIKELMQNGYKSQANRLSLSCKQIDEQKMKQIAQYDLSSFKTVDLYGNQMGDSNLVMFLNLKWQRLWMIYLGANLLTGKGFDMFNSHNFPNFENIIGNLGIKLLAKADLPNITTIQCSSCQIGNQSIKHLIKAKWPKFDTLSLMDNKINRGIQYLRYTNWKMLKQLNFMQNSVNCIQSFNFVLVSINCIQYINLEKNNLIKKEQLKDLLINVARKQELSVDI